jgi:hypothetical protein
MDIIKQYIIQCLYSASNTLRLNTQQIEVLAQLKEVILNSTDIQRDIESMKKITELSRLGIKFGELYKYLNNSSIDFSKFSDKFKEHSQYLVRETTILLNQVNPQTCKAILKKIGSAGTEEPNEIKIDLSNRPNSTPAFEKQTNQELKENLILGDEKDDDDIFFHNFEAEILAPIKSLDSFLKKMNENNYEAEELNRFISIIQKNGEKSVKIGFEIIANMHRILLKALVLIKSRELMPGKDVVESMRACLIVIAAVVRGKEVEITNYLNRAEEFGRKILTTNYRNV